MDPTEITYEMVARKLGEVVLSRGKKGVDRADQVDMLAYLATVARGPAQKVGHLPHIFRVHLGVLGCQGQPGGHACVPGKSRQGTRAQGELPGC